MARGSKKGRNTQGRKMPRALTSFAALLKEECEQSDMTFAELAERIGGGITVDHLQQLCTPPADTVHDHARPAAPGLNLTERIARIFDLDLGVINEIAEKSRQDERYGNIEISDAALLKRITPLPSKSKPTASEDSFRAMLSFRQDFYDTVAELTNGRISTPKQLAKAADISLPIAQGYVPAKDTERETTTDKIKKAINLGRGPREEFNATLELFFDSVNIGPVPNGWQSGSMLTKNGVYVGQATDLHKKLVFHREHLMKRNTQHYVENGYPATEAQLIAEQDIYKECRWCRQAKKGQIAVYASPGFVKGMQFNGNNFSPEVDRSLLITREQAKELLPQKNWVSGAVIERKKIYVGDATQINERIKNHRYVFTKEREKEFLEKGMSKDSAQHEAEKATSHHCRWCKTERGPAALYASPEFIQGMELKSPHDLNAETGKTSLFTHGQAAQLLPPENWTTSPIMEKQRSYTGHRTALQKKIDDFYEGLMEKVIQKSMEIDESITREQAEKQSKPYVHRFARWCRVEATGSVSLYAGPEVLAVLEDAGIFYKEALPYRMKPEEYEERMDRAVELMLERHPMVAREDKGYLAGITEKGPRQPGKPTKPGGSRSQGM